MRFLINAITFCCLSTAALVGYAEEVNHNTTHVEIGTEQFHETYRETVRGKRFVKIEVPTIALFSNLHIPLSQAQSLNVYGRYAYGFPTYTGAKRGGIYGSVVHSGFEHYSYNVEAEYAYRLPFLGLTPSVGAGYRRLTDRMEQVSKGGYKRISQYTYLIAALTGSLPLSETWVVNPKIAYHHLVIGKQYSIHPHLKKTFKQPKGYGLEVATQFKHQLPARKGGWVITPFYRVWHIDKSEYFRYAKRRANEPQNVTHEVGVKASYEF